MTTVVSNRPLADGRSPGPAGPAARWTAPLLCGDRSLPELIRRHGAVLGAKPYLESARDARTLSFKELQRGTQRWRYFAGTMDAGGAITIGLAVSDPLRFSAAFLGALAAGLWVAPLDPALPPTGFAAALERVGADMMVADQPAPAGAGVAWMDLDGVEGIDPAVMARHHAPSGRIGAGGVVLSSSGTTGPPKVVRLGEEKLLYAANCVISHHRLSEWDRGFNPLPLFHINAEVVGLLSTLAAGSCLVLDDRFHRTAFWDVMARRGITWINAVPAIVSRLADPGPDETIPRGIRFIRSASAPLPDAVADQFEAATGIPVIESYGMTEAASQITAHPLSLPRRPGSVGVPIGVELRIVRQSDPVGSGLEAPEYHIGHVEVRGPSVIAGYVGHEHEDRFSNGWLRTGDLGHRDADGFVYLDARTDDVINRGGEKMYPREIEEVIGTDPAVVSVAVVGRGDPELGQVPVAYAVLRDVAETDDPGAVADHEASAERIRLALERGLVRRKRPVALYVVRELPTGATGKVRRHALGSAEVPIVASFEFG
jgi:acyl-CoA synthetase (AMP-forming)/AMP-acid ligase II